MGRRATSMVKPVRGWTPWSHLQCGVGVGREHARTRKEGFGWARLVKSGFNLVLCGCLQSPPCLSQFAAENTFRPPKGPIRPRWHNRTPRFELYAGGLQVTIGDALTKSSVGYSHFVPSHTVVIPMINSLTFGVRRYLEHHLFVT